jgi:F0F1-type ATP synthase assembly protein I
MLWTVAVVLLLLWALGMVSATTMGGFIHVLPVVALVLVFARFLQGRRSQGRRSAESR